MIAPIIPAKSTDEPSVRILLVNRESEPLTADIDGFQAYDPIEEDEIFDCEYTVHAMGHS